MFQRLPENLIHVIRAADPARISEFLRSQGWRRDRAWKTHGHDWITPSDEHVLVPTDQNLQHYTSTISTILEMFVSDDVVFEDVLAMASNACSDIIRRKIDEPSTETGSCSLDEARSSMDGLKELLWSTSKRYAAKAHAKHALAKSYIQQCRAGQTEIGSYTIKIYTPVVVAGSPQEDRIFGRQVTIAAAENVSFLGREDYEPSDPLPAEMDWHVAESILKLKSALAMWEGKSELSVRFFNNVYASTEDVVPESDTIQVKLNRVVFDRAQTIYDTLKNEELFERMTLRGHITDLHKDAPTSKRQERRITVRVTVDGRERNVDMRLLLVDYKRAVAWHDDESLVEIDAKIDKRWRLWTAPEYWNIRNLLPAADAANPPLFP